MAAAVSDIFFAFGLLFFPFDAGTPGAGHTDKLGRLKELCEQHGMWLHVEGYSAILM